MLLLASLLIGYLYAQDCFTSNQRYIGTILDVISNADTNANLCQELCNQNPLCKFFSQQTQPSPGSTDLNCELYPSTATATSAPGYISGPKECACTIHLKEDVVFFMDYSGSIDSTAWGQETKFASTLTRSHLPEDTRVAAMGFGNTPYNSRDFYFPFDDTSLARNADRLANLQRRTTGSTHFEPGLQFLINGANGQIDWNQNKDRKRMLIIITDGKPSNGDNPCVKRPQLLSLDIITIVVGVGNGFKKSRMTCMVEDPDKEIFQATSFDAISDIIADISTQICKSDIDVELSEVRVSPGHMFVEFVNTGKAFNGSNVKVDGNVIIGNDAFDPVIIEENDVIVVGEVEPENCVSPCRFFQRTMNQNLAPANAPWLVRANEQFGSSSLTLDEVMQDSSWVQVKDTYTFSWELKRLSFDNDLSGNWRRSCKEGGSPGQINEVKCTVVCTADSCGDGNHCDPTAGCECNVYGYYQDMATCPVIPQPSDCTVSYYVGGTTATMRWNKAATDSIYGYKVWTPATTNEFWDTRTSVELTNLDFSNPPLEFEVATIGLAEQNSMGDYQSSRTSFKSACRLIQITQPPTSAPTTPYPTNAPTWPQPMVYLNLEYRGNTPQPIAINSLQEIYVGVRLYYGLFPFVVNVAWELVNGTHVQDSGIVAFPTHALEKHQDMIYVSPDYQFYGDRLDMTFRLKETTAIDEYNRTLYNVVHPDEVQIFVTKYEPGKTTSAPTKAPTWPQPMVYLSLSYDANNDPLPISVTTLETLTIGVRLYYGLFPFNVNITWEFVNSNDEIVDMGYLMFPHNAFESHQDLLQVKPRYSIRNKTEDFVFRLKSSNDKDAHNRTLYTLVHPTQVEVMINEASPRTNDDDIIDKMDWWVWLLLAIAVIIIIIGGILARYRISDLREKWMNESDKARQYSRDLLMHEEGGLIGVPDHQVFINPLHNDNQADTAGLLQKPETTAQMISMGDDSDFEMSMKSFEQTNIIRDSVANPKQRASFETSSPT